MLEADLPTEVVAQVDIIRASTTLVAGRPGGADAIRSTVALVIDRDAGAGSRLLDGLGGNALVVCERSKRLCGWAPRASLVELLRGIDRGEANRLEQAVATAEGFVVVHAASSIRIEVHYPEGPFLQAAEDFLLGEARQRHCGDPSCSDGTDDHDWDEREVKDEKTGELYDDTVCTKCGMAYDVYVDAASHDLGEARRDARADSYEDSSEGAGDPPRVEEAERDIHPELRERSLEDAPAWMKKAHEELARARAEMDAIRAARKPLARAELLGRLSEAIHDPDPRRRLHVSTYGRRKRNEPTPKNDLYVVLENLQWLREKAAERSNAQD
jgi:hypothetical protein